ncbi:MAG: SAM-dependent methyltransferase [Bacteroidota bacterium]|jgi:16S rRNA (cytidine1402-2'-O)-methyltransferase|nr:SAM-dependent methyltransferase [Bacteroidota bacterium]
MVYLIPSFLSEDAIKTIPPYVLSAVKDCQVIFAENERTARRFLKALDKEIVIDNFEWHTIHKAEQEQINSFKQKIKEGKNIAIISEAGCPGVADPGQILVYEAQKLNVDIKPLVGPNSILLALMASGLNGQHFSFLGYLPIDNMERIQKIKQIEEESAKRKSTQIFIETPFRNNKMIETILQNCKLSTQLCIAAELTSSNEWVKTKTIAEWKNETIDLHKKPVIYLLMAK